VLSPENRSTSPSHSSAVARTSLSSREDRTPGSQAQRHVLSPDSLPTMTGHSAVVYRAPDRTSGRAIATQLPTVTAHAVTGRRDYIFGNFACL
jgi:hypothetical protein